MLPYKSENELLEPLIDFLTKANRVYCDSHLCLELPWFGRRVDFATVTVSGRTTAYELKLRDNFKAIEQAAYNKLSFDRSYIVTATLPSEKATLFAKSCGVGIIVVTPDYVRIKLNSCKSPGERQVRRKLINNIRLRSAA
jgi:hypothetical protein